ncbi:MAG: GPR endopeptidase [Bacilli bacterium]|nr:GPR endopeptidase [Bacilli bacterium]
MHRIDLKNVNIHTDLVIEQINDKNLIKEEVINNIKISRVVMDKNNLLNKKEGNYITIELTDITNYEDRENVGKVLVKEIKDILNKNNIKDNYECLVIGLGNKKSTPDALGPMVIDNILVTRHLFELNADVKEGIRKVSAIIPGVMGNTGIETIDIIKGIVDNVKPKFIIVIDSLCASSIERLNKTIQLTDTGIHPGSGIGNMRKEISKDTLGIPVIVIGVPTVVESVTIVNDTLEYMFMHLNYLKNNYETSKLVVKRNNNYLDKIKSSKVSNEDKEILGGIIGSLDEEKKKNLISEVLNNINYNLIVTPKEIDFIIEKLANVISNSINNAINKEVDNY